MDTSPLSGRVALVAGATRGAGRALAVELARSGAFVYATGRSSRAVGASEIGRVETIEDTLDLVVGAGGAGEAVRVDHTQPDEVRALVERIRTDHGRLDVLVNDIFGGDRYAQFGTPLWEHDLEGGLRMLRMGVDTHVITSALSLPLMLESGGGLLIEMTDGPREVNTAYRAGVGFFYDYVKGSGPGRRSHRGATPWQRAHGSPALRRVRRDGCRRVAPRLLGGHPRPRLGGPTPRRPARVPLTGGSRRLSRAPWPRRSARARRPSRAGSSRGRRRPGSAHACTHGSAPGSVARVRTRSTRRR